MDHEIEGRRMDAVGHRRARRSDQQRADADQHGERDQGPAVHGPPPAAEDGMIGTGEGHAHAATSGKAWTAATKKRPRTSKFGNWSNEAQAGDSSTTPPLPSASAIAAAA